MKGLSILALAATALSLAACGSSSSNSSSSSSSSSSSTPASSTAGSTSDSTGGAPTVTMQNVAFSPGTLQAKVGQTVTFKNADNPPHNVTYVSGPKFTSSGTMNTGDTFSVKLTQPGTIHYVCTIHPFMKATITVTK